MTDSPRPQFPLPHWAWFLLATVGLVIAGIGLSIWLPYHREKQVIRKIEGWGGGIETEAVGPTWLRQLVGFDRMQELKVFDWIIEVDLAGTSVIDERLVHLAGLTNLRELRLDVTAVTDLGLAHLSRCKNVEYLSLNRTAATDSGLAHLNGLTNLKYLSLKGTAVTDAGLPHLSGLTNLEHLGLYQTAVTDNGIYELRKSLAHCNISY